GNIVAGSSGSAQLADGGVATADLADAAVTRAKLAPGALPGNIVTVPITAFSTATIGSWVPVPTLPALATRGANPVLLFTNHGLSGNTLTTPGDMAIRWVRGGVHLCNTTCHLPSGVSGVPMPSLPWLDVVPSAGAYVYELQVWLSVAGMGGLYGSVLTGWGLLGVGLGEGGGRGGLRIRAASVAQRGGHGGLIRIGRDRLRPPGDRARLAGERWRPSSGQSKKAASGRTSKRSGSASSTFSRARWMPTSIPSTRRGTAAPTRST